MNRRHPMLRGLPLIVLAFGLLSVPARAQFAQQAKLVGAGATNPTEQPIEQGWSVALSGDGNTAIVGGRGDDGGIGAAWLYARSSGVWSEQAKLVGTGAVGGAEQGTSVSLSDDGNTAIVGGSGDDAGIGAAWVFARSAGVWSQQAKLVGTGVVGNAGQGRSVSLSGDGNTAIVGGPADNGSAGGAWLYTRLAGTWGQQAKLVGTGVLGISGAQQGMSVALSGDGNTAIVGGPSDDLQVGGGDQGAAWVYTLAGGVWTQQAKLVGTGVIGGGAQGRSVSLSDDGNTAIVGGPDDNASAGAAWVYTRASGVWSQQVKLVGAGAVGAAAAQKGLSVSLSGSGNIAVVGGPGDNGTAGAAWLYMRSDGVWSQRAKLVGTGAVGAAGQGWSSSLSKDGTTALVGGPFDDALGAAWVFAAAKFAGTPGTVNCFGQSIAPLAGQYGGLAGAAVALGYPGIPALQDAILGYCGG